MRTWGGRFREPPAGLAAEFTHSLAIDRELARDDLDGSVAHVRGLRAAGLLTPEETERLVAGLEALRGELDAGTLAWDPALEDVHMNLEAALAERIGPLAGKLHTGRSRNDQVATDLRLWTRRALERLDAAVCQLERALVRLAIRERATVMPGQTHVQPAQPVLFAHHLLAYVEMLERDRGRLSDAGRRADVSVLGAGAIAGAGYPLDREAVARELGFAGVSGNSIDAVGDRDFVIETVAGVALAMTHLSRLAEELVWWSSPGCGWVRLAEGFSTGSSMMPNKRNPDPAELVRGRTARTIGDLTTLYVLLKGLPLGYQRDLQEDKRPLFDSVATLESCLLVLAGALETLEVDRERMRAAAEASPITATSVADALVDRGVPFRAAHHVAGALVAATEPLGVRLADVGDEVVARALAASDAPEASALADDPGIGNALRSAATLEAALERCDVVGGTAPRRVGAALRAAAARLRVEVDASGR